MPKTTQSSSPTKARAVYDTTVEGPGILGDPGTKLDVLYFWPHEGYDEDVRIRLFPATGRAFDIFVKADQVRAALDEVAPC